MLQRKLVELEKLHVNTLDNRRQMQKQHCQKSRQNEVIREAILFYSMPQAFVVGLFHSLTFADGFVIIPSYQKNGNRKKAR